MGRTNAYRNWSIGILREQESQHRPPCLFLCLLTRPVLALFLRHTQSSLSDQLHDKLTRVRIIWRVISAKRGCLLKGRGISSRLLSPLQPQSWRKNTSPASQGWHCSRHNTSRDHPPMILDLCIAPTSGCLPVDSPSRPFWRGELPRWRQSSV